MPHTRAAKLRALEEAAEVRDMLHGQTTRANVGGNDYLNWDLSGLMYQSDSLAWFPCGMAATGQPSFFDGTPSPTTDTLNGLPEPSNSKFPNANFCGLQSWYSIGMQDLSPVSPAVNTRPQLSSNEFSSYDSTSPDEESQPADQKYGSHPWSLKISRQLSPLSDEPVPQLPSNGLAIDLAEELEDFPSLSSEGENDPSSTARLTAQKRRKIAHSVIERKYRSRIMDGMTELRHCVPSSAKDRFFSDSKRPGSQQAAEDVTSNQPTGKVATLLDAVQYITSLKLQNEILQGQLDVMERRNNILQKIALSKVDTNTPAAQDYGED